MPYSITHGWHNAQPQTFWCKFDAPFISLDSSHTALVISGQECFVRYNNVPTPDQ